MKFAKNLLEKSKIPVIARTRLGKDEAIFFIKEYIQNVKQSLDSLNIKKIQEVIDIIVRVHQNKGQIFIIGNGGSASTASHMACDLGKSTIIGKKDRNRLKVISLADNSAIITAIANDFSYDEVFKQQLRNLSKPNDLLIIFSASGNSKNVIKAALYAKENDIKTIGFLGFKNGGQLAKLVDCAIIVQSNNYGIVEDTHLILNHIITSAIVKIKKTEVGKIVTI